MGLKKNNPGCNCCGCIAECESCVDGTATCEMLVTLPAFGGDECDCDPISGLSIVLAFATDAGDRCNYVADWHETDDSCGNLRWQVNSIVNKYYPGSGKRLLEVQAQVELEGFWRWVWWRLYESNTDPWDCSAGTNYSLPIHTVGSGWPCGVPVDNATVTFQ